MDDGGDNTTGIIILIVIVCIFIACIVSVIKFNSPSKSGSSGLTADQIMSGINSLVFTTSTVPNILQYGSGIPGSLNYGLLYNAYAPSNLGSVVSKNQNDCDGLCHSTPTCVGYTVDGTNCQLKKNVTIVNFCPGASNLYVSRDYGRTFYESYPYGKFDDGLVKSLWTFHGSLPDAVSNCHANDSICNGFTWDGNSTAVMYPVIVGLSQSTPGTVYTTLEKKPQFVVVNNTAYNDTPTSTSTENPSWAQSIPFNPSHDSDYFTTWNRNWDASVDRLGSTSAASNTLTVTNLAQCQNACVSNSWCQSFVFNKSALTCYQRMDQVAWPRTNIDGATHQQCRPGVNDSGDTCPCGVSQDNNFNCNNNIIGAGSGISNGSTDTYVRLNPPLLEFCSQQCLNGGYEVAWFDSTNGICNMYQEPPTSKQTNSTATTVWMTENFHP